MNRYFDKTKHERKKNQKNNHAQLQNILKLYHNNLNVKI